MKRRLRVHPASAALCVTLAVLVASLGMSCPPSPSGPGGDLNPPVAPGDRAPRIIISRVDTPSGDNSVEAGDVVTIAFDADSGDPDQTATVSIFASTSPNPSSSEQIPIPIRGGSNVIGPGAGSGEADWDTTGVVPASYNLFAEINDGVNPPVRVTAVQPLLVAPVGIAPENGAPTVNIVLPVTDAGVSNGGFLTVRGAVKDPNSDVDNLTITVFFDTDRNASNDTTNPPVMADMLEIPAGTVAPDTFEPFDFNIEIDLNTIPFRRETDEGGRPLPFFIRVQADDGAGGVVDEFAVGALRVLAAASDVVDLLNVGSSTAGVTFQGFNEVANPTDPRKGARAGSSFAALGDLDLDGLADFAIGQETASPFGAPNAGEVDVIYGRRRFTDPDAPDFESNQGRFAGVLDLNTVGSFTSSGSGIFNIRGSRLPNTGDGSGDIQGDGLGVTSIIGMPDLTGDLRPEIMVGAPYNINPFDEEDLDPCDTCTFASMDAAPFVCFANPQPMVGNNALTADLTDITDLGPVSAGKWVPSQPPFPANSVNTDPNVQLDLMNGQRIQSVVSLRVVLAGTAFSGNVVSCANFNVTAMLEVSGGPMVQGHTIRPDIPPPPGGVCTGNFDGTDDGMGGDPLNENNATIVFPLQTFPLGPTDPLPPSIYDGQFQLFLKVEPGPSVDMVDFTTVQVQLGAIVVSPNQQPHNIQFTYLDGLPFPISNNEDCDNPNISPPANIFALTLLDPVCPPMNQVQFPFASRSLGIDLFSQFLPAGILTNLLGVPEGSLDGHLCDEPALQIALTTASFSGVGMNGNDDISGPAGLSPYRSGTVYMADSDELVLTLDAQGQLADVDGDGNLGCTTTTLKGFGNDFGGCLNDGQRGAKFRGAWYNPTFRGTGIGPVAGPYDPVSLFGYTIDRMPDIDGIFDPQSELLISAPSGGLPASTFVDLSADLAGNYLLCSTGMVCTTDSKTATFNFGHQFAQVYAAGLVLTGHARNVASIRMSFGAVSGPPIISKELVLWRGTGSADGTLQYNQFFNQPSEVNMFLQGFPLPVFSTVIAEEFGVTIGFDPLSLLRPILRSGTGKVTLDILPNCVAKDSMLVLSSVQFQMDVLEGASGYVQVIQGQDWSNDQTISTPCALSSISVDGDRENGANRPESWPSTGCDMNNDPPTRDYCFPQGLASLMADEVGDAFGWAHWAGDLDADGVADIACGAPLSDNFPFVDSLPNTALLCPASNQLIPPGPALTNNGKTYVIFGTATLATTTPCTLARFELRGTHNEDQFGRVQGNAGDMNGDNNDDFYFAAEGYDAVGSNGDVPNTGVDAGFVGVLFGNNTLTGERAVNVEKVGTGSFLGCKFIGGSAGARLGGGDPAKVSKTFYPVDAMGNPLPVPADIELAKPVIEHGQYGVASAGDFNLDGIDDLLITAPGQEWPGAKITFNGNVTPGNSVTINGTTIPFSQSLTPEQAADALLDAIEMSAAETLNISAVRLQKRFPDPLPDIPTITFLARRPTEGFSVTRSGANIQVTSFTRQGAAYLIFGSDTLLNNNTFVLPDDLNRRSIPANLNSPRILKGIVFVSAYEKDTGPNDLTPDEAPVEVVSRIGDIDGDGFIDIILGAPEADFINILAPGQRRQSAGDAYVVYGNDFGLNQTGTP